MLKSIGQNRYNISSIRAVIGSDCVSTKIAYDVNLFWTNGIPVGTCKDTYIETVMKDFIIQKTADRFKELPITVQKIVIRQLTHDKEICDC